MLKGENKRIFADNYLAPNWDTPLLARPHPIAGLQVRIRITGISRNGIPQNGPFCCLGERLHPTRQGVPITIRRCRLNKPSPVLTEDRTKRDHRLSTHQVSRKRASVIILLKIGASVRLLHLRRPSTSSRLHSLSQNTAHLRQLLRSWLTGLRSLK